MMSDFAGESVHLTSTHRPFDTRVFQKECRSLVAAGYSVTLIVPHSADVIVDGVHIRAVPFPRDGKDRMFTTTKHVYKAALKENPKAVFHFHDAELLPFMFLLKLRGRRVIYDAHEDTPRQMLYQHWIPRWLRRPIAALMWVLEVFAGLVLDHIIAAEPIIAGYFPSKKTTTIRNYPMMREFEACRNQAYAARPPNLGFAGGISAVRGINELIKALALIDPSVPTQLLLAGTFYPADLKAQVEKMAGWKKVIFKGWVDRAGVMEIMSTVRIGVITRHPIERHLSAFPTKLFEYMAAGLPVVVSDLPTIRPIVEKHDCGILVNPLDPDDIARAIDTLLRDPEGAEQKGANGYKAIAELYNWGNEAKKLLNVYQDLMPNKQGT